MSSAASLQGISRDPADLKLMHCRATLDNVCYVNLFMKLAQVRVYGRLRPIPKGPVPETTPPFGSERKPVPSQTGTFIFRGKGSAESWD